MLLKSEEAALGVEVDADASPPPYTDALPPISPIHPAGSNTQYVYYILHSSGEACRSSKTSFDPLVPSLGRIALRSVPPPRTIGVLKGCIAGAEGLGASGRYALYSELDSPSVPLEDGARIGDGAAGAELGSFDKPYLLFLSDETTATDYIYYRLYTATAEATTLHGFTEDEPSLGRLLRKAFPASPLTWASFALVIARSECEPVFANAQVYSSLASSDPVNPAEFLSRDAGRNAYDAIVLVLRAGQEAELRQNGGSLTDRIMREDQLRHPQMASHAHGPRVHGVPPMPMGIIPPPAFIPPPPPPPPIPFSGPSTPHNVPIPSQPPLPPPPPGMSAPPTQPLPHWLNPWFSRFQQPARPPPRAWFQSNSSPESGSGSQFELRVDTSPSASDPPPPPGATSTIDASTTFSDVLGKAGRALHDSALERLQQRMTPATDEDTRGAQSAWWDPRQRWGWPSAPGVPGIPGVPRAHGVRVRPSVPGVARVPGVPGVRGHGSRTPSSRDTSSLEHEIEQLALD